MGHRRWLYDIVVLSVMVYFGAVTALQILDSRVGPDAGVVHEPVKVSPRRSPSLRTLAQYAIISERNLFGAATGEEQPVGPEELVPGNIPPALENLGLRLMGTVVARGTIENFAIIEDEGSHKQKVYHKGDRLKQALIKKILRHNVIIATGSGDQVLRMEPEEDAGGRLSRLPSSRSEPSLPAAGSIRLKRSELESSLEDLNQLMQQVQIRPFMEGKRPAGFVVSDIKPGSLFAKMGLRNGDVIKRINDQPIATPEQAMEFYQSLRKGGDVALEIIRGRRRQQLRYEIQ